MSSIVELWPTRAQAGSGFAEDVALSPVINSFDVSRTLLLTSLRRLRDAEALASQDDGWGTHLLMLRPTTVLAAKAAWILRPTSAKQRVGRALGVLKDDQLRGSRAIRYAVDQGAIPEFGDVARLYDLQSDRLASISSVSAQATQGDITMIHELGTDVNLYYGTVDAKWQMQLLWNAASGLAHGEIWFQGLSGGMQRKPFADVMTAQSFDVVCSAIQVTSLRLVELAS